MTKNWFRSCSAMAFIAFASVGVGHSQSQAAVALDAYEGCRDIDDNLGRLLCYDTVAGRGSASDDGPISADIRIEEVLAQSKLSFSEVLSELNNTQVEHGGWRYLLRYNDASQGAEKLTTVLGAVFSAPGETSSPLELFWTQSDTSDSTPVRFQPQFFAILSDDGQHAQQTHLLVGCEDQIESVQLILTEQVFEQLWNRQSPSSWVDVMLQFDEALPRKTQLRWTVVPDGDALSYALRFGRGRQSADLVSRIADAQTMALTLSAKTQTGQLRSSPLAINFDLGARDQAGQAVATSVRNSCQGASS